MEFYDPLVSSVSMSLLTLVVTSLSPTSLSVYTVLCSALSTQEYESINEKSQSIFLQV